MILQNITNGQPMLVMKKFSQFKGMTRPHTQHILSIPNV